MTQNKYQDSAALWNPLKEQSEPTLINIKTIDKMKKAKRYPVPEELIHMPYNFKLVIDSIMQKAYNESDNDYNSQASKGPDVPAPCNSQESHEEIEFGSS